MSENKPYSLGIIVGRFQVLHIGHEEMINKAIELCDTVGIFVGSSQESNTLKNPFSYDKRKEILQTLFGNKIEVYPLPDIGVGNVEAWGEYVLSNVQEKFGRYPDLFISGKETRRNSWLDESYNIAELFVPKTINISATNMIQFLLNDEESLWKQYVDPRLHSQYSELQEIARKSKDNQQTSSL